MTSHRLPVANHLERSCPRASRTPRSPPLPHCAAKAQSGNHLALVASCSSSGRLPVSAIAVDLLAHVLYRAPSLLAGCVPHAFPAMKMDSEDGELFIKVCLTVSDV